MEHKTLDQLQRVAELRPDRPQACGMSNRQRLDRWLCLLEANPIRLLNTLPGTEYQAPESLDRLRCANSAISVAHDDPLLRAEGLEGDSYGEARRFFGLSHGQLHGITCYCLNGEKISAGSTAWRLRTVMRDFDQPCLFARVWRFIAGGRARGVAC